MSIHGAAAIELSEALAAGAAGWAVHPMPARYAVCTGSHNSVARGLHYGGFLEVATRPNHVSPLRHFLEHHRDDGCGVFVRMAPPRRLAFLVQLVPDGQAVALRYWVANGWSQPTIPCRPHLAPTPDLRDGYAALEVVRVLRVRRPARRLPYQQVHDRYNLGEPGGYDGLLPVVHRLALMAVDKLGASLDRGPIAVDDGSGKVFGIRDDVPIS